MFQRFSLNYALLSIILDVVGIVAALSWAVNLRPHLPNLLPLLVDVNQMHISTAHYIITPFLCIMLFLFNDVYNARRHYRIVDELQTLTVSLGFVALVYAGLLYFGYRDFSRWLLVTFITIGWGLLVGWRLLIRFVWRWQGYGARAERRAIIVGAGRVGQKVAAILQTRATSGLQFVGYLDENTADATVADLPVLGRIVDARRVVQTHEIDDVIVAMPQHAYREMSQLVLALQNVPVNIRVVPDYFSLAIYRATAEEYGGVPMINLRDPALNEVQRLTKRAFDFLGGLFLLLLVSPVMGAVALAVRLDSHGPVFFKQKRVGENGRIFGMYKFRSMVPNADEMLDEISRVDKNGNRIFKFKNDPRVTRIGRFIRRTSLDELPQLLNVVKGDMSLVGPRPELPWLVQEYEPWQLKRFAVPQGITGWWQVNGRSDKPMHLNTEEDIYYVQNYSLWMDLYILLKTPLVVLRGKGAY